MCPLPTGRTSGQIYNIGGKKLMKKSLSVLLAMCMVLGFMPTVTFAEDVHTHCVCGGENSVGDHTTHTAVTWTGISDLREITTPGNYFLRNDVTLSNTWICYFDGVNLCLNGKAITGTKDKEAIYINSGASLTVTDCTAGSSKVGKIAHNSGEYGGGVVNDGTLTLYNGSIADNLGFHPDPGGVNNRNMFIMNGGSIENNYSGGSGGGVYNGTGGTFTMNGGNIEKNATDLGDGGGVYNDGTFIVSGDVNISGNVMDGTLENGVITGGTTNNVYLPNGKTVTVESGKPLAATAKVGITAENPASYPTVVTGTMSTTGFFSDNANYQLIDNGSNGLLLAEVITFSGVKLLNETGGEEMTGGKTYDGKAVAYDDSGVSYTPTVLGVSLTYTWQKLNGETYSDLTAAPKDTGSYRLLVSAVKNGYTLGTQVLEFTINSYNANGSEYSTNADENDPSGVGVYWQYVDYVVTAADGWQLSETNTADGSWVESLTRSEEMNSGSLRFYVRNRTSGIISEVITKHYKIDKTPPVISGIEDGKFYYEEVTVTVTDENFTHWTINGIPSGFSAELALPTDGRYTTDILYVIAADRAGNSARFTVYNGHNWGDWVSNGDGTHTRTSLLNAEHTITADCHGGEATCRDRAICDDCKTAYGALEPHNHTNLQHFPAKEATKNAEGNIEYWYCDGCGRYYSDMDGTTEIQKADTVIEKLKDDSNCNLIRRIILMLVNVVIAIIIKLVIAIKNLCR